MILGALPSVQRPCPQFLFLKFIWFGPTERRRSSKVHKDQRGVGCVWVCFNVRQARVSVLHAESAVGPCSFQADSFHTKAQRTNLRHKESLVSAFVESLWLCVKLCLGD